MKLKTFIKLATNWDDINWDKIEEYPDYSTRYCLPHITHGDYCGSSIEAANYRYLTTHKQYKKLFDIDVLLKWKGDYGSKSILIPDLLPNMNKNEIWALHNLFEELAGLDQYPLFNDELLSEIESELAHEQFTSCNMYKDMADIIFDKFEDELQKLFGSDFDKHDLACFELNWEYLLSEQSQKSNTYWQNESGTSMYINLDKALEKITLDDVFNPNYWILDLHPTITNHKLQHLHHQYTFQERHLL